MFHPVIFIHSYCTPFLPLVCPLRSAVWIMWLSLAATASGISGQPPASWLKLLLLIERRVGDTSFIGIVMLRPRPFKDASSKGMERG
jgi:hypothetical protein